MSDLLQTVVVVVLVVLFLPAILGIGILIASWALECVQKPRAAPKATRSEYEAKRVHSVLVKLEDEGAVVEGVQGFGRKRYLQEDGSWNETPHSFPFTRREHT